MYFIKSLIKLFDFYVYFANPIETWSQDSLEQKKPKTPEQQEKPKTLEQQELIDKINLLENQYGALKAENSTKDKAQKILLKHLKEDPSIKTDPEAKDTIDLFKRYRKQFETSKEEKKWVFNELKELKSDLEKLEFEWGIDIDKTWKVEKMDKTTEELKTITNREFLAISPEKRLQYITKNNIDSDRISSWEVKNLDFTFTFDWKYNKELYLKTTAGQVLPQEVKEVNFSWETYTRTWLKWEFFNSSNRRLTIHEWTKIEIWDLRTAENIKTMNAENEKKMKEYIDNPEFKWNQDILSQAISRNIDPKFIIKLFSQDKLDSPIISINRQTMIEDVLTEFDRVRPSIAMWNWKKLENWKYPDEFILKITRRVNPQNYEQIAKEFWVKTEAIDNFKARKNHPDYLSLSKQQEIISRAPENVKNLVRMYFPPEEFENALLVCNWESGFNSKAINHNTDKHRSTDRWLFQINDYYHKNKYAWMDIFNPDVNVKIASQIFKEAWNSWKPWYAARKIWLA